LKGDIIYSASLSLSFTARRVSPSGPGLASFEGKRIGEPNIIMINYKLPNTK
jgi:hypothetical protein